MSIGPPRGPAEASNASVLDGERGILAFWAFLALQLPGSPQSIFTMTENRASSFEQSWRDVSEPPGPSGAAPVGPNPPRRDVRGESEQVVSHRGNALLLLTRTKESPVDASDFWQSAQSLYCCPVSCRSSEEWVSGQGFFYARRQREGREGPLRNRSVRRHAANGCIKCFQQPRAAVSIHRCANPPLRQFTAIANPPRSPI